MPRPSITVRQSSRSFRVRARFAVALATAVGCLVAVAAPASAAMPHRTFTPPIESLTDYQPQSTCDPTPKPGVVAFRRLVLDAYPGTGDDGISRDCSIGGTSEHKEGRAWDWMVSVNNATQVAQVNNLIAWLFATDQYGNRYAMARRLGIMYIIWDKKIWGAYSADEGWRCYHDCPGNSSSYYNDPHTGHVHFSFDWAGARQHTTYWGYPLADAYRQWPGSTGGALGSVTTGPAPVADVDKVYVEDDGSVISAERFSKG